MATDAQYLFLAMMDVDPDREAEFNEVYDSEHIPLLLQVPGVRRAARYVTSTPGVPKYVAIYEVESPEVPTSAAFQQAADTGRWPHRIRPYTRNRRHILYTRISPGARPSR